MNDILKQVNPSIADGVRIFASEYCVPKGTEAFEEAVDYALFYWYGKKENTELLSTLPAEAVKRRTMNALNNRRKSELKHTYREKSFTDFDVNFSEAVVEDKFISPEEYIEAGGTNIEELDDIIDKKEEKNAKGREVVGPAWIDTRKDDEDYLMWTAMWTYYGNLPEKQQRYIKKHLHDKKYYPAVKMVEELGLPLTRKHIRRAERAFKKLVDGANLKYNEWIEAGKIED